ncbi:MAG: cAMP-binding proteins - catabolite gene activator and regulatory subunit of cAMP-dependent protein kinases, partial [uncultured Solirubrobacteraceae bacterium]
GPRTCPGRASLARAGLRQPGRARPRPRGGGHRHPALRCPPRDLPRGGHERHVLRRGGGTRQGDPGARRRTPDHPGALRSGGHLRRARDVRRRGALGHRRDARPRRHAGDPRCGLPAPAQRAPGHRGEARDLPGAATARDQRAPRAPELPDRAKPRGGRPRATRRRSAARGRRGRRGRARDDHPSRDRAARGLLAGVGEPLPGGARARGCDLPGPRADHGPRPRGPVGVHLL